MPILFDDELHVHYRQFYVESRTDEFFDGLTEAQGGQTNGLCGAAVPGMLFLTTGLHTGNVKVTIEVLDTAPPVGDEWEDVVEVSFRPATESVLLVQWAGEETWPLALEQIDYRVRYCATGMDQAREQDNRLDDEPLVDRYLLQLWPAPAAPDAVIRQTSEEAAYWHAHARKLPPPLTPEEKAEARRREQLAREKASREAAEAAEARRWGGRPPSERLRHVNGAHVVANMDRDLIDEIERLDEAGQRAVAAWAARQACVEAGLSELDWVAPALAALDRGEPLPPPFDDFSNMFQHMHSDTRVPRTAVRSYDGRHARISQQHAALPAVWAATATDAAAAAVEALFHASVTFGDQCSRLLAEVRHNFPGIDGN